MATRIYIQFEEPKTDICAKKTRKSVVWLIRSYSNALDMCTKTNQIVFVWGTAKAKSCCADGTTGDIAEGVW